MSRIKKRRHCLAKVSGQVFKPAGIPRTQLEELHLFQDELETLRLCDLEGLTQEQAGEKMGVSRGTVQRILTSARRKCAETLVKNYCLVFKN
jgi:predicted DNA-binding protein (UPF0251 family)